MLATLARRVMGIERRRGHERGPTVHPVHGEATLTVLGLSGPPVSVQLVTTDFPPSPRPAEATEPQTHEFVGLWATEDGRIRHELLSNGRYDEARGTRESAWRGRYRVTGDIIQYWDDTGSYADGQFRDGVLYHGGVRLLPAPVAGSNACLSARRPPLSAFRGYSGSPCRRYRR